MSRRKALALGWASAWPLAYAIFFFGVLAYTALFRPQGAPPPFVAATLALHLLTAFLVMGLLLYDIAHLFRTPSIEHKAAWAAALLAANILALPVYWYFNIWREGDA